jgi:hypothetical protein
VNVPVPAPVNLPAPAPAPPSAPRPRDPHLDRVLLLPTAETQPRGTVTLSSYDLVVYQLGYAPTDSLQLTLSATPPIEGFFPFDLSLKSTLARGAGYRLAAIGSASGILGLDDGPAFLGRLGLVGQACLDAACRSSANLAFSSVLLGPATLLGTGAGVILHLSDAIALLGEVDTLIPTGRAIAEAHGIVAGAGLRWRGRRWALDASVFSALDRRGVLPLLVGSYRFLPD